MRNIIRIVKSDFRGLARSGLAWLLIAGMCLLPVLYAGLNIYACWDPYENLSGLKIAVYSEDQDCTLDDGTVVNMSDELLTDLRQRSDIGWTMVETREEAEEGVKDGTYYGSVVIEKDFTSRMFDFDGIQNHDGAPTITFYQNQKKNPIATRMTDSASTVLKRSISQKYIKALMTSVFGHLNILEQDLENLEGDTDDSRESLLKLKENMDSYQKAVDAFISADRLLMGNLDETDALVDSAIGGISSSIADLNAQKDYTQQLRNDLNKDLNHASDSLGSLDENIREMSGIVASISQVDGVQDLTAAIGDAQSLLAENVDMLKNIQKILDILYQADGDLDDVVFTACDGTDYLLNQTQGLLDYIEVHYAELTAFQTALKAAMTQAVGNVTGFGWMEPQVAASLVNASTSKVVEALLTAEATHFMEVIQTSGDPAKVAEAQNNLMEIQAKKAAGDSTGLMMLSLAYAGVDTAVLVQLQNDYAIVGPVIKRIETRAAELQAQYKTLQKDLDIILTQSGNLLDAAGVEAAPDAIAPLQRQVNRDLQDTVAQLEALSRLSEGSTADPSDILNARVKIVYTKAQTALLRKTFEGIQMQVPDADADDLIQALTKLEKNLDELQDVLDSAQTLLDTTGEAQQVLSEASTLALSTAAFIRDTLQPQSDRTFESIEEIMDEISALLVHSVSVMEGGKDVIQGAGLSLYGVNNSLSAVQQVLEVLADRIQPLTEDIENLQDAEIIRDLKVLLGLDPEETADFFATPVEVHTNAVYPVQNYGSGMAPFYTSLAIWIGNIILTAVFLTAAAPEGLQKPKTWELYFGRYVLFFVLNEIQTVIILAADLFVLKIQCLHPVLFFAAGMTASFAFSILIYSLALSFGVLGKAAAILLFIMQIAGSGGTYPIQLLPETFQALYRFLPFDYSIGAMRACIAGTYEHDYFWYLAVLLIFAAVGVIIGLKSKAFEGFVEHMEEKMEETGLM
ncbi:MAG: YhgE/Pip family protein [Anaerovoracaceae bacterium]